VVFAIFGRSKYPLISQSISEKFRFLIFQLLGRFNVKVLTKDVYFGNYCGVADDL